MVLGGWNIDEVKGINLPQKVQSAFTAITGGLVGAEYTPVLYAGSQVVDGINHRLVCIQTLVLPQPEKRFVKMIINIAPNGSASLVSVSGLAL